MSRLVSLGLLSICSDSRLMTIQDRKDYST
jgi:hypothetical protein